MSDYKVIYDGVDLSPCCERGMTDYVYTIDPLGAETPEQAAERKAAERKPSLGIAHILSIVATMLVVAALFTVVGAFYGASDPDAVKDLMPSVPSLSGGRAEPEESAK